MSKTVILHLKRIDWVLLGGCLALAGLSLPILFVLGKHQVVSGAIFWKQLAYVFAGALIAILVSFLNIRIFQKHGSSTLLVYAAVLAALGGLFFFGKAIRGTTAWYHAGGFSVAPVEFAKIALVALLAKFFSDRHRDLYTIRHVGVSLLYAAVLAALVFAQPDAGSALVILGLWLGIVFFTGIRARWIAALVVLAAMLAGLSWQYGLKPYQKERVMTFFNPEREKQGSGYNVLQSRVAIGSGGFWGKNIGGGSQSARKFLPEASTDFMFAAFAEAEGLVGVLTLFFFFGAMWHRMISIGARASHNFGRMFAFGYALLLAIHFFVNIGMNLGIFPVIGIPLPFVSYGGSHILASFIGLGIVLAIGRETLRS